MTSHSYEYHRVNLGFPMLNSRSPVCKQLDKLFELSKVMQFEGERITPSKFNHVYEDFGSPGLFINSLHFKILV